MECGSRDFICYLLSLVAAHGVELLSWVPLIEGRIRENLQAIIGLAGFSFGVWKWWYSRESVLHKRLEEYLEEQDNRLINARTEVLRLIERPAPSRRFETPLFAASSLRRILTRRRWISILRYRPADSIAAKLLEEVQPRIRNRLDLSRETIASHRNQLATALILLGAVNAARAGRSFSDSRSAQLDREALMSFRRALQIPGASHRADAKELEAHQLRRLRRWEDAKSAYAELENWACSLPLRRKRDITIARAKRYSAEILQIQAEGGSTTAKDLMKEALELRLRHAPFKEWSAIEQADMHYVLAYFRNRLGHSIAEDDQLDLAIDQYGRVLEELPPWRSRLLRNMRILREAAQNGKSRCKSLREKPNYERKYNVNWMYPLSQETETKSGPKSQAGSDQRIDETPKQDNVYNTK